MSQESIFSAFTSRLFTPKPIKSYVVKNRLMRSAMAVTMADPDGFVTEDLCSFYRKAAEGGVGLMMTGAISVHPRGKFLEQQMVAHGDEYIPGLKRLADTVHQYGDGVVFWAQLHCGGAHGWGYSYGQKDTGLALTSISEHDIHTIIDAFAQAALRTKNAGFDGVQLHGGHGYLIAQFLSPATNPRRDKWGGTPENRMRFVLEVYRAIREKVGDQFPVGIKMNTADYLSGGNWLEDTAGYAGEFARAGFDLIEMSGGMAYMTELRESLRKKAGPGEAYFREAIPRFREATGDTALAIVGGIRTPAVMEQILSEGVDFISLARPFLSEPELPVRIQKGDIRPAKCATTYTLCNLCLTKLAYGSVTCVRFFPGDCVNTCPIRQNNPVFFTLVAQGRITEALEIIKNDNPLANVLSRVCHKPCEAICRGGDGEPLAIRDLKRFVTDFGLKNNLLLHARPKVRQTLGKVAIIGSGPAGLTCAYYLAQMGCRPVVFEKRHELGGMLTVIPEYRLPRDILAADLEFIRSAGVEFKTGVSFGLHLSLQDLFTQGYKAVFLAMGAGIANKLDIDGEDSPGVMDSLTFLRDAKNKSISLSGTWVGVIGGGNAAVDSARTALRLGARQVLMIYRRVIEDMPALPEEVNEALAEGVEIIPLVKPLAIAHENRALTLTCIRMGVGEENDNGRRQVIPLDNSEFSLNLDQLIIAVGESRDIACFSDMPDLRLISPGMVDVSRQTLQTSIPGVFAGGDLVAEVHRVAEAASTGRKAAESIIRMVQGRDLLRGREQESSYIRVERVTAFAAPGRNIVQEYSKRAMAPVLPVQDRIHSFAEVNGVLSADDAIIESKRCLKYTLELAEKSAERMAKMDKDTFLLECPD